MSPIQIPIDAITSRFGDRFNSLRNQSLGTRFANLRPISEFLDFKRVSKPANFGEAQSRVNYNLSYFSSNYAAIFVLLSIYSLLTNPLLLFVIILVAGGLWGIGKLEGRDLELGFARFNTSQLYTGLLLVAVPLGFWASPISTALWLIGATGVTKLIGIHAGRGGVLRSMVEHEGHDKVSGSSDGADYDIYEDSDSTVAYAVELALKDNEKWLVEKALEKIRRAHSKGHKNVTLSNREMEALECKRLQMGPSNASADRTSTAPPPPYPLDPSIFSASAKTTSASVSQTSTTTLRAPLQPPFASSVNRVPAFVVPPTPPRPYPYGNRWTSTQQTSPVREPRQSPNIPATDTLRGPQIRAEQRSYMNDPSKASFVTLDPAATAPELVANNDSMSDYSNPRKRSPASSGDGIPIVEAIEHKVPNSSTHVAGKSSCQRSTQP
ncbi:PRA1 family protein-domain-containing protein [Aspergillus crustosus]